MINDVEDRSVKIYSYLLITDNIKSCTKYAEGNLEYVKGLLQDFLDTTTARTGIRLLRELAVGKEVILICDNMGIIFFSSILADTLRNNGIVVKNYGGENET